MMIVVLTLTVSVTVILLSSPSIVVSGFDVDNSVPAIFNTIDWIPLDSSSNSHRNMDGGGSGGVGDNNAEKLRPTPPVSNSWIDPFAEIFVGN